MQRSRRNGLISGLAALALTAIGLQALADDRGPHRNARADERSNSEAEFEFDWTDTASVTISSTKDLGYVVVWYCDQTASKHDDLDVGGQLTLSGKGPIHSVAAKAGTSSETSFSPFQCEEETPERDPTIPW